MTTIQQPIDPAQFMPRADGREPGDQLHGRRRPDGTPDPDGNLGLSVRVGDLIEWLSGLPDDMAVCVECDGSGPEGADSLVAETLTAHDDPDPYEVVVIRPALPADGSRGYHYLRATEVETIRHALLAFADDSTPGREARRLAARFGAA